ncbi:2OG-Fe(II) oxygenase [Photorhabdus asymbiotica]|uniref:2OG-Fe(II) oxygenase n=1 Tax=Photorhabdus asymbiotica TaxID=291112 RepID=UPI003DA6F4AB
MMNFSNFKTGTPWPWSLSDNILATPVINNLIDNFPEKYLQMSERKNGSDKTYLCKQLKIYSEFETSPIAIELNKCWLNFIEYIKSNQYRENIERITNCKLANGKIEIILNQYIENCFMSPHTDREPKLVTHLIYLSGSLGTDLGGEFVVHDTHGNAVNMIEPYPGRSIVFKRSDHSLHSVNAMRKNYKRNSIQIVFWSSQPKSSLKGRIIHA